jgi:hypothetical protein
MEAFYTSATPDVALLQLASTRRISTSYPPQQNYIRFFNPANFPPALDKYNHTAAVR